MTRSWIRVTSSDATRRDVCTRHHADTTPCTVLWDSIPVHNLLIRTKSNPALPSLLLARLTLHVNGVCSLHSRSFAVRCWVTGPHGSVGTLAFHKVTTGISLSTRKCAWRSQDGVGRHHPLARCTYVRTCAEGGSATSHRAGSNSPGQWVFLTDEHWAGPLVNTSVPTLTAIRLAESLYDYSAPWTASENESTCVHVCILVTLVSPNNISQWLQSTRHHVHILSNTDASHIVFQLPFLSWASMGLPLWEYKKGLRYNYV